MKLLTAVFFASPDSAFVKTSDPLVFEKELVHVGTWQREDDVFEFDAEFLDHWAMTFDLMKENGITVPVPVGHTSDPEKNRGFVQSVSRRKNAKGIESLFAVIKFVNDDAAKYGQHAATSIHSPPMYVDGKGAKYAWPIVHVALTNCPVISGLEPFRGVTASLVGEEKAMTFKDLAKKLGVTVADDANDDAVADAIAKAFAAKESPPKDPPAEDPPPKDPPVAMELPKIVKNQLVAGRIATLESLVADGRVTKAVADKLKAAHCTEQAISLSLVEGAEMTFDAIVEVLKANERVINFDQLSSMQTLPNRSSGEQESPVVKDAKRRAKQNV